VKVPTPSVHKTSVHKTSDLLKALDEADLKKARALLRSGEYSKVQVADELEISRHTLWRAVSLEKTK
jgi:transcriptional regulator with PAS, ATPase and Fis domain